MCASPTYLERMGTPKSPDELIEHQCLVYSLIRDFETWHLHDAKGKLLSAKIRPYLKESNGESFRDAAVEGKGIILVPSFIVYKEIECRALIPLLTGKKIPR